MNSLLERNVTTFFMSFFLLKKKVNPHLWEVSVTSKLIFFLFFLNRGVMRCSDLSDVRGHSPDTIWEMSQVEGTAEECITLLGWLERIYG